MELKSRETYSTVVWVVIIDELDCASLELCALDESEELGGTEDELDGGVEEGVDDGVEFGVDEGVDDGVELGVDDGVELGVDEGVDEGGLDELEGPESELGAGVTDADGAGERGVSAVELGAAAESDEGRELEDKGELVGPGEGTEEENTDDELDDMTPETIRNREKKIIK